MFRNDSSTWVEEQIYWIYEATSFNKVSFEYQQF